VEVGEADEPGKTVWSHAGIICTGETYKNVVKTTFAKGASLEDPSGLFNASLEGNTRRAIDFHEDDKIDEKGVQGAHSRRRGAEPPGEVNVDDDLESMTREQLMAEAKRLRTGIRAHRDSTGHALCWHHPALWGLLPEKTDPLPTVPTWPEFLRGCLQYRESLDKQLPRAPRSEEPYRS
jgi:hypothetical protein